MPENLFDRIRLLASAGAFQEARDLLDSFFKQPTERTLSIGEIRQIIPIALLINAEAVAERLLTSVFATTRHVDFSLGEHESSTVVMMQVRSATVTFILSVSIFSDDQGEHILQRLVDIYPILGSYLESHLVSDGTVAISLGDGGAVAGLSFCDYRPGSFPIPDAIFMAFRGYERVREYYKSHPTPWVARSPVAFWRGSTTGMVTDSKTGWRSLPRLRLCEIGLSHPDMLDAKITSVVQLADPGAKNWIIDADLMRPSVPPESFQQYKYQIDIDGNTTSWPGLFMKLMTGSTVLKVAPRDGLEQWSYGRLKPWKNFVPLASDMSDLVNKVGWLQRNDDIARRIGHAGLELASDLSLEREIMRAVPIVAAAFRDASGEPVADLDFALAGNGLACLRDGWMPPDQNGTDAVGFQSRIELNRPPGIGGFVLRLEISNPGQESQPVSVALNGRVMTSETIKERTRIYLPLARRTLSESDAIELTLLHPTAAPAVKAPSPEFSNRNASGCIGYQS